MKLQSRARWLVMSLMLTVVAGCASMIQQVMAKPELRLTQMQLMEANLMQQRYRLTLEIKNPNPLPLPVDKIRYQILLAGKEFASGETVQAFRVPANGETTVDLDVSTNLTQFMGHLSRVLSGPLDKLDYAISGEVATGIAVLGVVPFQRKGEIPFNKPVAQGLNTRK